MGLIECLGISPEEVDEQLGRGQWERWVAVEPALGQVRSLAELEARRGHETDAPLGALVRLAAKDGGDDQLAAAAVAHQLVAGAGRVASSLRDLCDDIDAVVAGALWAEIRSFPWRRRTHAYAASLLLDTRGAVVRLLLPGQTRTGPEPLVWVDPQSPVSEWLFGPAGPLLCLPRRACDEAALELTEFLDWALAGQVITADDVRLLLELVAAGDEVAAIDTPQSRKGAASQAAVLRVAQRQGVCGKTVTRRRDRVLGVLRDSAAAYLADVA